MALGRGSASVMAPFGYIELVTATILGFLVLLQFQVSIPTFDNHLAPIRRNVQGRCGLGADQRGAGRIPPCDAGAFETIGCDLLELDNDFVSAPEDHTACNTAMLGPALVVTSNGVLGVTAGLLVTLRNDFFVFAGGELILGNDPGLLP